MGKGAAADGFRLREMGRIPVDQPGNDGSNKECTDFIIS